MQLNTFLLSAVTVLSTVTAAYKINGDNVNCRAGPNTVSKVIKVYAKGHDVRLTCQTPGETINGDSLWDKTTDKCYVADWFVETGTGNMVVGSCDGGSGINGRITRKEAIARGRYWVNKHVPYSMDRTYPDPQGTRYRTDCSGFVSMALHITPAGLSTVTLPQVVKGIAWKDLKPGDLVGTLGPGTGGAGGHVTMFLSWVDPKTKKEYHSLECQGGNGCVNDRHKIGWKDGSFTSAAYRYIHIAD